MTEWIIDVGNEARSIYELRYRGSAENMRTLVIRISRGFPRAMVRAFLHVDGHTASRATITVPPVEGRCTHDGLTDAVMGRENSIGH